MAIDEVVRHAADLDYYRSQVLFLTSTPAGEVLNSRDLCLANTGAPFAEFNVAFLKPPVLALENAIKRAEEYFGATGLPFRIGVRDDYRDKVADRLTGAGYVEVAPYPAMILPAIPNPPPAPAELEILTVEGGTAVDEFRGVAERGFGFPAGIGALVISDTVIAHPDTALLLGRVDGVPVATSLLQMSNQVAGIYFVACEAAHRRRGYGEAVTWASVSVGAARGASVASLQASVMGRPVYERMGFEVAGLYHYYASPGSAPSGSG